MLFWLGTVRESVSKKKAAAQTTGDNTAANDMGFDSTQAEKEKKVVSSFNNDEICVVIIDVSLQRMLKRTITSGGISSLEALELWSDEFGAKTEFGHYRSRLLELIKLVASQKQVIAASRVSQRIDAIRVSSVRTSSVQDLALMESMQLGLETIVNGIFDGSTDLISCSDEIKFQLHKILEGLLQQLLSLKWTGPALSELLGRYLGALGPYLRYFPNSVAAVINKLFELLNSLPSTLKDASSIGARNTRLQICSSFIRIARAVDRSLLHHMKSIADTMAYLQGEGKLLRGEHNLLGEGFLIMAAFAGAED